MNNYRLPGPQIAVRGVRATIPSGYIIGRSSAGPGPAELIPISGQGGLGSQMQQNGTVPTRLAQLADVGIVSLADKQRFRYSASLGKWTNVDDTLSNLSDVDTTGISTGKLLEWNGTKWVPFTQNVDNLANVTISSPIVGQALAWNGTIWTNQTVSGGGGGSSTLAGDTDVSITSPSNGQVLTYNSGTGKWVNQASAGGSTTLAGDTDVSITSVADQNILQYNAASTKWKNVSPPWGVLTPPLLASFATTRLNGGTMSDAKYGFLITQTGTATNTNALAYAINAITRGAGSTFTLIMKLRCDMPLSSWAMTGIIFRNSGSGSSVTYALGNDGTHGFNKNTWTNDTTWSGVTGIFPWGAIDGVRGDWWMKVVDNNVNRTFFVSLDGDQWVQFFQESSTTFITPTHVGVFWNPNFGGAPTNAASKIYNMTVLHWSYVAS